MKRHIYTICFIILGILCGVFVYGLGSLYLLRQSFAINSPLYLAILIVGGGMAGYFEGRRWWRIIYVEKAYLKWKKWDWRWKSRLVVFLTLFTVALILFLRNYGASGYVDNYALNQNNTMRIESSAFENNGTIPAKFTCDGDKINPPLDFSEIPAGTKTLALIMEDPDVPKNLRPDGMFDHWIVWNMPASTKGIVENTKAPGVTGLNSAGGMQYTPPCPPDREHRYFFYLYALDDSLQIPPTSNKTELVKAMEGHIIESAMLMGRYNRQK